jgi:hypothetical protein
MKRTIPIVSLALLLALPEISFAAVSSKSAVPSNPLSWSSSLPQDLQLQAAKPKPPRPPRPRKRVSPSR